MIDGVLYLTFPDHVWAIDARSGREIWHHAWNSVGGIHIGNRGAAAFKNYLYFETPDCHLVSLDRNDRCGALGQDRLRPRPDVLRLGGARGRSRTT